MAVQLIRKVRDRQPERSCPVSAEEGLAHVWALNVIGSRSVLDSAGRANGVFGVGTTLPTGNYWVRTSYGWGILFDDTGTGTLASKKLNLGDTSGSAWPTSEKWSFETDLFFVAAGSFGSPHTVIGSADAGGIQIRITSGIIQLLKQQVAHIGEATEPIQESRNTKITVTYDGATANFYIDGKPSGASSASQSFTKSQCLLGWTGEGNELLGNGSILGRVVFTNRVLSAAEVLHRAINPWQIFEPETIPLFFSTVTAQYARPTSDVSAGTWTASSGSDLFAMLDETAANDTDYIVTTGASTCEVALGALSDPASSSGHIVRYRIAADSGGITVRLRQGTTTIATWTHASAPTSLTTYEQTLTGGEADSITNYAALKLQFEAT